MNSRSGVRKEEVSATQAAGPMRSAAFCLLGSILLLIAGCGSATKRVERDVAAAPPAPAAARGGYYQDDGPGDNPPANLENIADAEPRIEPLHRFANNPYTMFGQQYVPNTMLAAYKQRGVGSWYGRKFHGQRTSSGETYDMYGMSAAHATLPIPSYARVTNLGNGKSVIVRINDRGPFHSGRLVDLSYAAAYKLGYAGAGSAQVEVEAITSEHLQMIAAQKQPPAGGTAIARPVAQSTASAAEAPPAAVTSQAPARTIPVDTEAGGVYLQLGAFSGRDNAENFRAHVYQQLAWLNDAIEIYSRDGMYRLHLGPYHDRVEAGGVADKIGQSLQLKPILIVR